MYSDIIPPKKNKNKLDKIKAAPEVVRILKDEPMITTREVYHTIDGKDKKSKVLKMTTTENRDVIQGLLSYEIEDNFIFVNLVENAVFNRGKEKLYEGVGGNLFAYACKLSFDMGFGGFVSFKAKTALIEHYKKSLGAEVALGQRMYIGSHASILLINQYFKNR